MVQLWTVYRTELHHFTIAAQQILDVGDRVVLLGHAHSRGAASGIDVDSPLGAGVDAHEHEDHSLSEIAAAAKLWVVLAGPVEAAARATPLFEAISQGQFQLGERPVATVRTAPPPAG
jgi:hypothetical protein